MIDKTLFVDRLKVAIVSRYADSKHRDSYLERKRSSGKFDDVRMPPGCRDKFKDDLLAHGINKESALKTWLTSGRLDFPDAESLYIICKVLNVSSDYLLGLSDRKESYDDIFISEKMGLVSGTITRIKDYDKDLKSLLNGLVDCNVFEEMNRDFLNELLVAVYHYGMSAYDTSVTTKDIFGDESVINSDEETREMLKYPANSIFNFCLDISPFVLKEKRARIYDLKDRLAQAREKELEAKLQKYKS